MKDFKKLAEYVFGRFGVHPTDDQLWFLEDAFATTYELGRREEKAVWESALNAKTVSPFPPPDQPESMPGGRT